MLIPQFSLRWLLATTAALAVVSLVAARAVQGSLWAAAVTIAIGSLALILTIQAIFFALVWLFSLIRPGDASLPSVHAKSIAAGAATPEIVTAIVVAEPPAGL